MSRTSYLTDLLSTIFERRARSRKGRDPRPIAEQCEALLAANGEATALTLATSILDTYAELETDDKRGFFEVLTGTFDIDPVRVIEKARAYEDSATVADLRNLAEASEPRRQPLFRRLNQVDDATAELVGMRADLLGMLRDHPEFGRIDLDLRHLFASWFNRGFLVLRRINWQTPANILEKIIAYEAVHAINDWDDLRRRLQPADRRCYAYFHPCMPDDPLIFVEVALTRGIPGSIQAVLAEDRAPLTADETDTAVFYSISNCQSGLAGISFGNSLIKQVVADLSVEHPQISTFVTLSPIPGFARWLEDQDDTTAKDILAARDNALLGETGLLDRAHDDIRNLAAEYLLRAKRPNGSPANSVARFHLANGAQVENVHANADLSENGLTQACGAMVNYLYDPDRVERRSDDYATESSIPAARQVEHLARNAEKRVRSKG